jgi:hypothetical protein
MAWRLLVYSAETDRLIASLDIPELFSPDVEFLAGVNPGDDKLGEYPLTALQAGSIAERAGLVLPIAESAYSVELIV